MDKKSNNIMKLIKILSFIIGILLVSILLYLNSKNEKKTSDEISTNKSVNAVNVIDEENNNIINSSINTASTENESLVISTLKPVTDVYEYFCVKEILNTYYKSKELKNPLMIIDEEAIDKLGLTSNNYQNILTSMQASIFRIDEIYKQIYDENNSVYVVYHKLSSDSKNIVDSAIWIRVNMEEKNFSIFPYEYLKLEKRTGIKDGNLVPIDFSKDIKKNENNVYKCDKDDMTAELCVKELFEKYKFDLLVDQEHLYNQLVIEYKNCKFPEYSDFIKYIKENEKDLKLDTISEFKTVDCGRYVEYQIISSKQKNYVFNAKNLMSYGVMLDNYEIVQDEQIYNAFLPAAQARYCIERVVQAINYGDYIFAYQKLNTIQKNNNYRNYNDFEEFIKNSFYIKNSYKIDSKYIILSEDSAYQFTVNITNANNKNDVPKKFTIAVYLKDNNDFEYGITYEK